MFPAEMQPQAMQCWVEENDDRVGACHPTLYGDLVERAALHFTMHRPLPRRGLGKTPEERTSWRAAVFLGAVPTAAALRFWLESDLAPWGEADTDRPAGWALTYNTPHRDDSGPLLGFAAWDDPDAVANLVTLVCDPDLFGAYCALADPEGWASRTAAYAERFGPEATRTS